MACPDKCQWPPQRCCCSRHTPAGISKWGLFLNIFWERKAPPASPCSSVETTRAARERRARAAAAAGDVLGGRYMHELPYGGWVAPNIFYLGYSGCILVGGLRIAGFELPRCACAARVCDQVCAGWSGIYDGRDFERGHHEQPPSASLSHAPRSKPPVLISTYLRAGTSEARCTRATT